MCLYFVGKEIGVEKEEPTTKAPYLDMRHPEVPQAPHKAVVAPVKRPQHWPHRHDRPGPVDRVHQNVRPILGGYDENIYKKTVKIK